MHTEGVACALLISLTTTAAILDAGFDMLAMFYKKIVQPQLTAEVIERSKIAVVQACGKLICTYRHDQELCTYRQTQTRGTHCCGWVGSFVVSDAVWKMWLYVLQAALAGH